MEKVTLSLLTFRKMDKDLKCKTRKMRDQDKMKLLRDQVIKKGK